MFNGIVKNGILGYLKGYWGDVIPCRGWWLCLAPINIMIPLNIISEVGHMPPPPGAVLNGNGLSVAGPLARSPEDLELAMKVLVGPKNQDQLAWDIKLPKARTKKVEDMIIAVWPEEKYAEVDKDISNLINETAKDLKEAGAKVEIPKLPFEFKDLDYVFGLFEEM